MINITNSNIIVGIIIIIVVIFIKKYNIIIIPKKTSDDKIKKIKNIITDNKNNGVIKKTLKELEKIKTDLSKEEIRNIIFFVNNKYQNTNSNKDFYDNLINDDKINEYPYNTEFTMTVYNIINNFDKNKNNNKKNNKNKKKVSFKDNQIIPYNNTQEKFELVGQFQNFSPF